MLPHGIIVLWFGNIAAIPSGWRLCDGNNGTPDLCDKFIVGAGDSFPVDDTGGSDTHTHDFTSDPHFHNIPAGDGIAAGYDRQSWTSDNVAVGETDSANNIPPYHALAYIMKI